MTITPENPDTLLTRDHLAAALTAAGFPVKAKTLATKATRGGGPSYRLFGTRPLYRWGDALAWARARLSTPRHSTSRVGCHYQRCWRAMMKATSVACALAHCADSVGLSLLGCPTSTSRREMRWGQRDPAASPS